MPKLIAMSKKELTRYEVIRQFIAGKLSPKEASIRLNLSTKQIGRLAEKVSAEGAEGLVHKLRGKKSNRKTSATIIARALTLLRERYADFKPSFAAEKLRELHGIALGRETTRQLMVGAGLWKVRVKKTNGEYHAWRERRAMYGELEQFDGSYHCWFENRASECCLLAAIDDATGRIVRAEFGPGEGIAPVFIFWREYMLSYGKPSAIYLDRGSTYKVNAKSALDDPSALSQFERAMGELGVEVIHARSPQAKGRIERLFGTLQDRLVKELRLAGISKIPEANIFLRDIFVPAFNARFAVIARSEGDGHRALPEAERAELASIFSVRESRTVRNDFTLQYSGKFLQLKKDQPTLVCRKDEVRIEERLDGTLHVFLRGKELGFEVLPERPEKATLFHMTALSPRIPLKPAPDHPWRKPFMTPKNTDT